ncbi:MAG: ABC transporter ATP-binding protein [Victivallaceae bacterium]|jgi:ABC-type lipoprotein export system ATPase subunit
MTEDTSYFLETSDVYKSYRMGKKSIQVLNGVNLQVKKGSWTALLGASGSGKTTLLNLLGTLEQPDKGRIVCDGIDYAKLGSRQANRFRNERIGFIFQAYHMLPELNLLENVSLPGMLGRLTRGGLVEKAEFMLERVGLKDRLKHHPAELSGGEQQRAAIARALINSPDMILADEPTGNLDSKTGAGILQIFQELHGEQNGRTIIMITHDHKIAALADSVVQLQDGVIVHRPQ